MSHALGLGIGKSKQYTSPITKGQNKNQEIQEDLQQKATVPVWIFHEMKMQSAWGSLQVL